MALLFTLKERELLDRIERSNKDELIYWRMPNIIYPFAVILISIVCFLLFKQQENITLIGVVNLLFNGSLPMVALNRMSSLGSNLFKFDKAKERAADTHTTSLRVKIDDYSKILIICIAILYIYQVINSPFPSTGWLWLQLLTSSIFIYFSLNLSKYGYLLQERLIEITLGDNIKETAKETKQHLSEKYDTDNDQ